MACLYCTAKGINRSELAFILKYTGYNEQVCRNDSSKRVILNLHDTYIFVFTGTMSLKRCCVHTWACMLSQNIAWRSIVSKKYVLYCPNSSFWKPVLRLRNSAQFFVLQFSRKSCLWKIISVCVCCVLYIFCETVRLCVLREEAACSRVDAKGQKFVGVQIVEGAQVWEAQEEFGEEGGVIWATASDQGPQGPDQTLLELLHSPHVQDAGTIWGAQRDAGVSGWQTQLLDYLFINKVTALQLLSIFSFSLSVSHLQRPAPQP